MEIPSGDPQTGELYGGRSRAYTRIFGQIGIIVLQKVQVDKIERRQRVLKGSRMAPRAEKSENWQLRAAGAHTKSGERYRVILGLDSLHSNRSKRMGNKMNTL